MKIIIMLRNPLDRAFSAYTHVSRSLKEPLSFEEALEIEENRLKNDETALSGPEGCGIPQ